MDFETVAAAKFGHSLTGISVNLLVRDVLAEAAFLTEVFEVKAHRLSKDFAIMTHAGMVFQLYSDGTFADHPLYNLLPESGPRGAGIELRLHESDPDLAVQRVQLRGDAVVLSEPADKLGHGLREAVILCPNGYAWVPSRRLA
jgi:hypothetical protein